MPARFRAAASALKILRYNSDFLGSCGLTQFSLGMVEGIRLLSPTPRAYTRKTVCRELGVLLARVDNQMSARPHQHQFRPGNRPWVPCYFGECGFGICFAKKKKNASDSPMRAPFFPRAILRPRAGAARTCTRSPTVGNEYKCVRAGRSSRRVVPLRSKCGPVAQP